MHSVPAHEDIGHGIYAVDAGLHRPGLDCCYLVVEGSCAGFIDTGTGHTAAGLLALLDHLGIARRDVCYVMPTHVHLDHAGGTGALMRELPNAIVLAHPRAARHLIDPAKLIEGATAVYGAETLQKTFGSILPIGEERVRVVADNERLDFNGRTLVFLDTPGHARHHYCVWDEKSRGIFTGDTFGISYREFDLDGHQYIFPTTTPVQFEPEAWQATLDRLMSLKPQRVYLTHFGCVSPVEPLADALRTRIDEYVRIAKSVAPGGKRHEALQEALAQASLRHLREMNSPFSEAQARELLAMDFDLNAQGLGVWLDRPAR
jgi:glyoxylase-like metal-dependent hydrolase (beta-lactamase superfamily II)